MGGNMDMITRNHPDNFMQEQRLPSPRSQLASDRMSRPLWLPRQPGTVAAIRRVKDMRPDINRSRHSREDPALVESVETFPGDRPVRSWIIVQLAHKMGAIVPPLLIPSAHVHGAVGYQTGHKERQLNSVWSSSSHCPDPMSDAGIPGTAVYPRGCPRQVAEHGTNIALFGTNAV